jgi:hypothetical protein
MEAPQTGLRPTVRVFEDGRVARSSGEFRLPVMMLSPHGLRILVQLPTFL